MDKNTIRTTMLSKRNALTKEFVETSSNIIIEKLLTYTKNKNNILIFMDMKNEVQVTKLLSHLKDSKINIFIPKIFPDGTMKINIYQENELILNPFGFYESSSNLFYDPATLDLVIVPGVAFDKCKNRIGFGKGYYDYFFASFNTDNTTKIGICYDFQLLQSIPHDKYDVKMDLIITESEVIV